MPISTQVTVTSTPGIIAAAANSYQNIYLHNLGGGAIYVGGPNVTTSNGYKLDNGDKLSCHSSGTAIDLNATKHPLAAVGTFPADKVPMIRALAKKYGLTWGGDYRNRKDEMHFEITVNAKKAAKLIAKLGQENAN